MNSWQNTRTSYQIQPNQVHLGQLTLSAHLPLLDFYQTLLNSEEKIRAERLIATKNHARFIIARAVLKLLVAEYLNLPVAKIEWHYTPLGKLQLKNQPSFYFNMSHSGDRVLYAFAHDNPVGVDVEKIARSANYRALAQRFFATDEIAQLINLPSEELQQCFFALWTRKEALVKAIGAGLTFPLRQFSVTAAAGETNRLISLQHEIYSGKEWYIQDCSPDSAYQGAWATNKPNPEAIFFTLDCSQAE